MKFNLPNPCSAELDQENFCSRCQHHILNISLLGNHELDELLTKQEIKCAIISKSQLKPKRFGNTIFNVLVFTSVGILPINSQAQQYEDTSQENNSLNLEIEKKQFKMKLIENDLGKLIEGETFRLLINDQLILDTFEINQEYTVLFEAKKYTEINLRIASNQQNFEIEKLLHTYNFPEVLTIKRSEFSSKSIIMGKMIYKPQQIVK